MALMHFHRGNKVRPELQEFRVGISKSREAINNSIGTVNYFIIGTAYLVNLGTLNIILINR
jgi:hypothetical protein